jgi:hypothetical protein
MAMAPSPSMLFRSYHQLLHGPVTEAEAPLDGGVGPGAGGFRFGFRNVLFATGFLSLTRRDNAPVAAGAEVKQRGCHCHAGGDREEEKAAALGNKFEEAVRLSCWST